MTTTEVWISLAAQAPLLVCFVVFSLEMYRRFDASLSKRDEQYEKRNQTLADAIDKMSIALDKLVDKIDTINSANAAHIAETRVASMRGGGGGKFPHTQKMP